MTPSVGKRRGDWSRRMLDEQKYPKQNGLLYGVHTKGLARGTLSITGLVE